METLDFDSLLRIIRMEAIVDEEPRIAQLLADVNFNNLCRFLMQYYEGEKRCRYFDTGSRSVRKELNNLFIFLYKLKKVLNL